MKSNIFFVDVRKWHLDGVGDVWDDPIPEILSESQLLIAEKAQNAGYLIQIPVRTFTEFGKTRNVVTGEPLLVDSSLGNHVLVAGWSGIEALLPSLPKRHQQTRK